jgi:formaldehyde-activating enzyme
LIGDKDGPVGNAFANALARQSEGHTNLLAVPRRTCLPSRPRCSSPR